MNKSKGNMYPWVTHTKNPLGGKCLHGCTYCSTNKLPWPNVKEKYLGPPRLICHEFEENLGTGKTIFICGQTDLFAVGVDRSMIINILSYLNRYPDNTYLFQSKNPKGFAGLNYPKNSIFCTTIETNRIYPQMGNTPPPRERAFYMFCNQYITIEPIMDFDLDEFVKLIRIASPKQVNIGADSGNNGLPEPPKEKILQLIERLGKFTKVELKDNLKRLL